MAKQPVDIGALILERMKESGETEAKTLDAITAMGHAVEGFAYALKAGDAPDSPPAFETGTPPARPTPAADGPSAAGGESGGSIAEVLAPLVEVIAGVRDAVAAFRVGAQPPAPSGDGGQPARGAPPDVYGFAKETASGDDSTYGLQDPIIRPSTMAPDRPEVPTLKEADSGDLFASALQPVLDAVNAIRDAVGTAVPTGAAGGAKPDDRPAPKPSGEAGTAGGVGVVGELGALAGAASAVTGAFTGIVGVASGFVQALNPAIMEPLGRAFNDLSAVIGTALTPIISGATEIVRSFADTLTPVMAQLQPVVQSLTQTFVSLSAPIMELVGKMAEALMPLAEAAAQLVQALSPLVEVAVSLASMLVSVLKPVITILVAAMQALAVPIKMVSDLLLALTPIFEVISAVASGVASALQAAMEGWLSSMGGLKDTFAGAQDAVKDFAKTVVLAIASFSKLLGFDSFLKGFVQAFDRPAKQDSTGMAAITNTKMSDFASFSREVSLSAAKAGMGAADVKPKQTDDWLKEVVEQLKEILDGSEDGFGIIDAVTNKMQTLYDQAMTKVGGAAYDLNVESLKKVNNASALGLATAAFNYGTGVRG